MQILKLNKKTNFFFFFVELKYILLYHQKKDYFQWDFLSRI